MALTLQNTHDTREDIVVQNVFIDGMVVEEHLYGTTTVSHVNYTCEYAYGWFARICKGREGHSDSPDPQIW